MAHEARSCGPVQRTTRPSPITTIPRIASTTRTAPTFHNLSNKLVALRTPEQLQRFVDDHWDGSRNVLVSADTGGRPERYQRGVDFVLMQHEGALTLIVPGAHARNAPLLHNPRWQALGIALEGNRTALQGVIPSGAEREALQVLGELGAWLVSSEYRDWYNNLAVEPPARDKPAAPDQAAPLHPPGVGVGVGV